MESSLLAEASVALQSALRLTPLSKNLALAGPIESSLFSHWQQACLRPILSRSESLTDARDSLSGGFDPLPEETFCLTFYLHRELFRSLTFIFIFLAGVLGTFPLFVPPFFIPLYAKSIGMSSSTGAGLLAGFNLASAAGRICCGVLCDKAGALNVLMLSLLLTGLSMLVLWPQVTTLAPFIVFVILNGASNGGFFSTVPTVVGNVFGSSRVSVAMGMIVTGWAGGYFLVSLSATCAFGKPLMRKGAPIAGYILDAHGGADSGFEAYRPSMFYAGSLALAASGLVAAVRFRKRPRLLATI